MGELWIYWRWTHILEWSYARQYYWVRLAKKNWMANHFQKNSKPTMNASLNKAQHKQELLCGSYLALVGMCI
jgi:hypothetical protein